MINGKKGLQLKKAFFAVIVLSMVIIAVGVIIGEWNTEYDAGLEYDLGSYNKLTSMTNEASNQQGSLSSENPGSGSDFESETFRASYGIITKIFTPFEVVFGKEGLLAAVTNRFGLPDYVRQGIVALCVFAFIFAIVAIIFRIPGGTT